MSRGPQFVLFPMGERRFALPAEKVAELAKPDRLQSFPHTTPLMSGVLVRRGHIVPVCDVAEALVGRDAPARRFYLIASCEIGQNRELLAIPVTGECELSAAEMREGSGRLPEYVTGLLAVHDELVQVISLELLMSLGAVSSLGTGVEGRA